MSPSRLDEELGGVKRVSHLRVAEIERVEIEIKGVGDASGLLNDDDGGRCSA